MWNSLLPSKEKVWDVIIDSLQIDAANPFVIGVSGSVASGKSTFAQELKQKLKRIYPDKKIAIISADNFLKSNAELEAKGLMEQKGFPISFNWDSLENFFKALKSQHPKIPYRIYSHELSDLVPNKVSFLEPVDILIIEGIYLLQDAPAGIKSPREYINTSIYLDASEENLYQWYLDRFHQMLKLNYDNPGNFFYSWAHKPIHEADDFAQSVWKRINLKNLHQYIAPTKNNASIIVKKTSKHNIKKILVKNRD